MSAEKENIVVLTGNRPAPIVSGNVYSDLLSDKYQLVFIEEQKKGSGFFHFYGHFYEKYGLLRMIDVLLWHIYSKYFAKQRFVNRKYQSQVVCDINDPKVIDQIVGLKPKYIVASGCSMIKGENIRQFKCPIINLHNAITPRYRNAGVFWSIFEGNFDLVGSTIHFIDEGIDTGERISIYCVDWKEKNIPLEYLPLHTSSEGARLLSEYILYNKQVIPQHCQNIESRYYPCNGLSHFLIAKKKYREYLSAGFFRNGGKDEERE